MPPELSELYFENTEESENFRTYIRTYNNMFAFTSLGVKYDKELARRNCGIYTFRVQGQMYHFIDDLIPSNKKPRNLPLYFYDYDNELANRMACLTRVNESIVKKLMDILKVNPYTIFIKSLLNVPQLSDFNIALKCHSILDQQTYNLPSSSEIAALWLEENHIDISTPHIRIYTHSNKARLVHYYYGCYDLLQYPLLFPFGENGWHCGIKKIIQTNNVTKRRAYCEHEQLPSISNMCSVDGFLDMEDESLQKGKRKRDTVSCREYYCYKFQIRDNETNDVIHCGRIFQQFIVDVYIKLETQILDFFSFNPDLFRIEVLQGLFDILRCDEREASKIGKKTFLPITFIGGPRDMRRRYMNAIALVQYFGKPDIFITMTCNPSWPEIKEHLSLADEVHNGPDLVSRVFRAKVEELKTDILKRQIFGRVAGFMYTIEFQKRGLPHAHFLIILADKHKLLTPESYDKFVCAELPDSKKRSRSIFTCY
ncbi:uncharacterized protein LOC107781498 [Nicotiana tabacum]|uniref:Uncharacterized protein LOC107781498 n=2 Tax=Nicotiana tabacum TaxID=4097 RepID=A0AC58UGR4_TOBAC